MRGATLVGGSGSVGTAVLAALAQHGRQADVVDLLEPAGPGVGRWLRADLLHDEVPLDSDVVVLAHGTSDPRPVHPWRLPLEHVIATARLLPGLRTRRVVLLSTVEVYGRATGRLTGATPPELPLDDDDLREWCERAAALARTGPADPWRAAPLCRELVDGDPSGRWVYAMAKRAEELLLAATVPAERLSVIRVANLFGTGQDRVVARLARRALVGAPLVVTDTVRTFLDVADLARAVLLDIDDGRPGLLDAGAGHLDLAKVAEVVLDELGGGELVVRPAAADDSSGEVDVAGFLHRVGEDPALSLETDLRRFVRGFAAGVAAPVRPPLPVVVPPRPERPDVVADRVSAALWSGVLRDGPWTAALVQEVRSRLALDDGTCVLATSSGTAALRLAVRATAGTTRPGAVAVLPAFTFAATAEVLVQLGYQLRFCDVDELTWTLDPDGLVHALAPGDVQVVVAVDALGVPADYERLSARCATAGVALVADSAPSLAARHDGRPLGTQAAAHAFSMSFAKVVSAGGGGGVLVSRDPLDDLRHPVDWTRSVRIGEVAAAAALDQVESLDRLSRRREDVAAVYRELLGAHPLLAYQRTGRPSDRHGLVHWTVRVGGGRRDALARGLAEAGIGTKPYYAPVLHRWPWGDAAEPPPVLPVSEALADEALALPMSSEMTPAQAERVALAVRALLDPYV